eukprot:symbB.v1.2.026035.t1/scaffold2566.1/size76240/1
MPPTETAERGSGVRGRGRGRGRGRTGRGRTAAADQAVDAPGVSGVTDASSSLPNRRVSVDSKEPVVKLPPSCVKTQAQPPAKAAKQLEMPADVGPSSTAQRLMHLMFADDSQDMPMSPPVSERVDPLPPAPAASAAPAPPAVVQA